MKDLKLFDPFKSFKLYGLSNYLDTLIKIDKVKKLPKTILLTGKKGIGKHTLIIHFLNYIFDTKFYDLKNQIISPNSIFNKSIINNTCQNLIYISSEKTKIDDIRNLKSLLSKSSLSNLKRFIILDDVEKLNLNCSNALLKIIEEPTGNNYFILINNQGNKLLETISSRCFKINIFITVSERVKIIKSLIELHNLKEVLDYKFSALSPGNFLIFNQLCLDNNISTDTDFLIKLDKLLKLYKKNKDINLIKLLLFLTDFYFYELCLKNTSKTAYFTGIKNKTINIINNYVNHNLNLNLVLNSIQTQFNYGK